MPLDGGLRVTARFEPGSITRVKPQWQLRDETADRLRPTMLAASGAILLAGFAGLFVLLNGMRREPAGIDRNARANRPPSALPVAMAAVTSAPGAYATSVHGLGALIDLARRGVIRFAETGERAWYRSHAFQVTLVDRPATLHRHEQVLLDALFHHKGAARTSLTFVEALTALRRAWSRWRKALAADIDELGFLSPDRQRVRRLLIGTGIVTTAVSFVCLLALAVLSDRYSGWPMLVPGAFDLVGLVVLISGAFLSPLSDHGRHQAAEWRAFFNFLKDVSKGRAAIPDEAVFARYLPFAVALGIGPSWSKAFRRSGRLTAVPAWFAAASAADATRQLNAFMALIVVTQGAGHSGSGAGATAGAGGGGSSGAS